MLTKNVFSLSKKRARILLENGRYHIATGDFDGAVSFLQESLQMEPTAEAYTYLGWVLSLKGDTEEAIELCLKAIRLDPDFGNPYNDIGSYLIKQGRLDDAIPWLERAKEALHYDTPHFPYINMGRIYSNQGKLEKAIEQFQKALNIEPDYPEIQKVLHELHILMES